MKNNFRKTTFLIFCGVLVILLFSCKNPFLANADGKYQVSFETNCETKIESYRTDKIEAIQELTKEDYVFGGWYTSAAFDEEPIKFPYKITQDITLYAKWIEIPTVTFVTNCDTKIDSYRTDKIEAIQELTKEDYVFDGWYTSAAFDGEPIKFPYKITQDITLYAKWIEIPTVTFETNCETKIGSYRTDKIVSIQELTRENYEFDGWYTSESFEGESISFPYEVRQNVTLYAKWIDKNNILTFEGCNSTSDFAGICNSHNNVECIDGLLTIGFNYEKIIFKNSKSTDLCIKLSNPMVKLVFENFSFSSSKGSLIESSSDIFIEYYGNNELSSSSSNAISLISSLGTVEFRGKNNGKFELQPNTVTNSTDGSVGVKANKVIIDGGNFVIKGSDGWNNSEAGRNGGAGSSGIKGDVEVKNNAIMKITGGNGANGNAGTDGKNGEPGWKREWVNQDRAGNGEPGENGTDGGNGGSGGCAIDGNLNILTFKEINLTGGNGGNGAKGGNGGNGGKGGDNVAWGGGTGNGGAAGNGGKGGNGGDGGDAISGSVDLEDDNINLIFGQGGKGESGGWAGNRGLKGQANDTWGPVPDCGDGGLNGAPGKNGEKGHDGNNGVKFR